MVDIGNRLNSKELFLEKLKTEPVFCFTSDMDWAAEPIIQETLKLFSENDVPLTPFITHDSEIIREHYQGDRTRYVGLHPNFRHGSDYGTELTEIVSNLTKLWPEARCFRCHSFVDSALITKEFYDRGFKYDSNLCLHLQTGLVPLNEREGLLRFPVFLEDDVYARREGVWNLSHILDLLKAPGLKIFNFHPIHIALNTPNIKYYECIKDKKDLDKKWKKYTYTGDGVRTFLVALLHFVKNNPGLGILFLDDLYLSLIGSLPSINMKPLVSKVDVYDKSTSGQRAEIVRTVYETKDGTDIYSTSRDFNLRELEIDFIINVVRESSSVANQDISPKIIDIGCGNGYTDIRITKTLEAEVTGIDFSSEMIRGAKHLTDRFRGGMMSPPVFQVGDVRKLCWDDGYFDIAISERCLLNLPDKDTQYDVIREVRRVLKKGGIYIMVEGTRNGLARLNELRIKVGLDAIPDRAEDNASSLKFEEKEVENFLSKYFELIKKQHFGMYYLISRVVHPLLVYPNEPEFDARINEIARKIACYEPDYKQIGHVAGFVLKAI